MGLEPTISRATIWRFDQLSYVRRMARLKGLEPLTYGLEGRCSIQLSYRRKCSESLFCLKTKKSGAGDGNRTHAISLEG